MKYSGKVPLSIAILVGAAIGVFFSLTIDYKYLILVCLVVGGLAGWFLTEYYEWKD